MLGYAHANAAALKTMADHRRRDLAGRPAPVAALEGGARPAPVEIPMGGVEEEVNPYSGRTMHKRTSVRTPEPMADETTFASTDQERVPAAYFVPAEQKAAVELLRARHHAGAGATAASLPLEESGSATRPPRPSRSRTTRSAP